MPSRPKPACIAVGCSNRTEGGAYCPTHSKERWKAKDARRGTSWSRGYDSRHREWRKLVIGRDPICKACNSALSTIADHIKPLAQGGGWEMENGQGMCHACHNKKTVEDNK